VPKLRVLSGKRNLQDHAHDESAENEMLVSRERATGYLATRYIDQ